MTDHDLLNPPLGNLYVNQLRQTIDAYDPQHIVLGEALQNAIDAIAEAGDGGHTVGLEVDFADRRITVRDDGVGFPNKPNLLFLGGTQKLGRGLYGMIGAGLKVVLFSSQCFTLRSRAGAGSFRVELRDANRFDSAQPPELKVPESFMPDPDPLAATGTEVSYWFPQEGTFDSCFARIVESCLPGREKDELLTVLASEVSKKLYPSRLAALIATFLRRFTYVGDVRGALGKRPGEAPKVVVSLRAADAVPHDLLRTLADNQNEVTFEVEPSYLTVEDTAKYSPPPRNIAVYRDKLGRGGSEIRRTAKGVNHLILSTPDEYASLLINRNGAARTQEEFYPNEFAERLYEAINGITLTIGRIPDFERCLPGGSRRLISANGVVTSHDLNVETGTNQQYVRCIDLAIDVNAKLNYGKTHLTDRHLVGRITRYVNAAYGAVLSHAAAEFVGKFKPPDDESDAFLSRVDLGLEGYVLRKVPTSEQDVIALFFEMAGHNVFGSYRIFGLSSKDTYDARAGIATEAKPAELAHNPTDERDLAVVEFKHTASEIVRDFLAGAKDPADLNLLIAWREGSSPSDHYIFEDIKHSDDFKRNPSRVFAGVERYIEDSRTGNQVQVLLLDKLVKELK
jgi:hypothetical protein